jgi:hypothetical protein
MQTVHDYWLKTIDLGAYLLFNLKYNIISLVIILLVAGLGILKLKSQNKQMYWVLLFQIFIVIAIPLTFSYVKFPILVDRYSFALAPALYTLLAVAINSFYDSLTKYKIPVLVIICIALSVDGLYHSLADRKPLRKESWKEMAAWLKKQEGYPNLSVYSVGMYVNKRFSVDYYIPENKAVNIMVDTSGITKLERFYLVETNAHDRIPDTFRKYLDSNFRKEEILFGLPEYAKGGVISIYTPIRN